MGRRQPDRDRPRRWTHHHLQPLGVHRRSYRRQGEGWPGHRTRGHHRMVHGLPPAFRSHPQRPLHQSPAVELPPAPGFGPGSGRHGFVRAGPGSLRGHDQLDYSPPGGPGRWVADGRAAAVALPAAPATSSKPSAVRSDGHRAPTSQRANDDVGPATARTIRRCRAAFVRPGTQRAAGCSAKPDAVAHFAEPVAFANWADAGTHFSESVAFANWADAGTHFSESIAFPVRARQPDSH